MLSGNGRHRRPRQAPALVVAAGVTGAGIAMPLLGAGGASAADTSTWDHVAQCESGGMWSADTGNGFFGGLQMTQDMWEQNGGRAYAPTPDRASRAEQIAVAERILDAQGPAAWPNCGVSSGLAKGSATPEVNPGRTDDTPAPAPERSAPDTPDSTHTPAPDHVPPSRTSMPGSDTTKPAPNTPNTPSAPATTPAPSGSASPSTDPGAPGTPTPGSTATDGTGKHRKDPSGDPATPSTTPSGTASGTPSADPTAPEGTGKHRADTPRSDDAGHASRGAGDARTTLPDGASSGPGDYTVRPGDNLSAIAQQHSVDGGWHELYQDNQKVVGSDPDLILPGQKLELKK
ncbi:transglycosylase family protein [Streptomyces sp. NPDC049577]|uniref:transglycosylase family protein n=1 Tax=Streptomyces sp. NPDC049577 TaxID=3155153 RepID=UPI00342E9E23